MIRAVWARSPQRPRRLRGLAAGTALAAAAAGAVAVSAGGASGPAMSAVAPGAVTGLARPSAPRGASFISLWPACGCTGHTVLEQFSRRDGRRLRALARVPSGLGERLSDPHANPGGPVWLTLGTGPAYGSDVAGGDPRPNTCTGAVVRYDPVTLRASTVVTVPHDALVADAIPDPGSPELVMLAGGCATSYFDMHYVVENLRTGRRWTLGADARRCHALSDPGWSADGAQLVFAYGPSRLSRGEHLANGTCTAPRNGRIVVTSAGHGSPAQAWRQTLPDSSCSYRAAAFDRAGIAAVEACAKGSPAGRSSGNPSLGKAYLVQLDRRRRVTTRIELKRGWNGGAIAGDPRTGSVLISEAQADNNGGPSHNWAWSFDGRRLRLISRYPGADASTVVAEPW